MIIMVSDVRWHFSEMREPLFVYFFLNTFKYVSAQRDVTLLNASVNIESEECDILTFPNKVRHHKVQHRDQQQRFRHTAPHD